MYWALLVHLVKRGDFAIEPIRNILHKSTSLRLGRRPNQSVLKEINPEYSLKGLMPKLKLQYFGHLMGRVNSLEKTLMLGKIEGRSRRGWQDEMVRWHRWLNGHEFEQAPGVANRQGKLTCWSPWCHKESDMAEQLNNNNNNNNKNNKNVPNILKVEVVK